VPADHFLPATYIARFSSDVGPSRRQRVFVLRAGAARPDRQAAEQVARIRGLYDDVIPGTRMDLEHNWNRYESHLPQALAGLISGAPVDGRTWLQVLVPFVASALLRGPDFDARLKQRLDDFDAEAVLSDGVVADMVTARVIELQRLLTVVMVSGWVVLTSPINLICNDLGWTMSTSVGTDRVGFTVPLDSRHALLVVPLHERDLLRWRDGRWTAEIARDDISPENAADLNGALQGSSGAFTFGVTEELVLQARSLAAGQVEVIAEPLRFAGFDHRLIVAHEFEWYRATAAAYKRPEEISSFDGVWDYPAGWAPPAVIFPTNLPEFSSGLRLHENTISLGLYPVPGFTAPPYWPGFERGKQWPSWPGSVAVRVLPEKFRGS
jgi:hypothetical protein